MDIAKTLLVNHVNLRFSIVLCFLFIFICRFHNTNSHDSEMVVRSFIFALRQLMSEFFIFCICNEVFAT